MTVTIQEAERIACSLTGSRFLLRVGGFDVPVIVLRSTVMRDDVTAIRIESEITTEGQPFPTRVEAIR